MYLGHARAFDKLLVVMRARMTQIQENIRDSGLFGLAKSNKLLAARYSISHSRPPVGRR